MMKIKMYNLFCILMLVFALLLIVGCSQPAGETPADTAQQQVEAPLTDDQLLAQYPDSLDEALQDLDQVE